MGELTKLQLVTGLPTMHTADERKEWDGIEWVPAGTLARRAAQEELRRRDASFAASGCVVTDAVYDAIRKASLRETSATRALEGWWPARDKPWLVLSGPTGVGKTVAVAHALWMRGGRFVRADELVRLFASMFGEQYEKQQELRDAYMLVIDDIGGELDQTRMLPALLDLLDSRKSALRGPTIVTTNLSKKDFAARYGNERLLSRMAESVHWASLSGEDLRRSK